MLLKDALGDITKVVIKFNYPRKDMLPRAYSMRVLERNPNKKDPNRLRNIAKVRLNIKTAYEELVEARFALSKLSTTVDAGVYGTRFEFRYQSSIRNYESSMRLAYLELSEFFDWETDIFQPSDTYLRLSCKDPRAC